MLKMDERNGAPADPVSAKCSSSADASNEVEKENTKKDISPEDIVICGWCKDPMRFKKRSEHSPCFDKYHRYHVDVFPNPHIIYPMTEELRILYNDPRTYALYADDPDYWEREMEWDNDKKAEDHLIAAEIPKKAVEKKSYKEVACSQVQQQADERLAVGHVGDLFLSSMHDDDGIDYVHEYLELKGELLEDVTTDEDEYAEEGEEDKDAEELVNVINEELKRTEKALIEQAQNAKSVEEQDAILRKIEKSHEEYDRLMNQVGNKRSNRIWDDKQELDLLFAVKKVKREKQHISWKEVKKELPKLALCESQIKRKFYALFDRYKKVKANNNETGQSPKTCKYFEIFETIFAKDANVVPVFACSSIKPVSGTQNAATTFSISRSSVLTEKNGAGESKNILDKSTTATSDTSSDSSDNETAKRKRMKKCTRRDRDTANQENEFVKKFVAKKVVVKKRKSQLEVYTDSVRSILNESSAKLINCINDNNREMRDTVREIFAPKDK